MELFIPPREKFLILQETEAPKKFLIFSQKKAFLIFLETENPKKFFIFQEKEHSHASENRNPKKFLTFQETEFSYISRKGTFLYFGKGIFRTLTYLELEAYSEP